MKYLVSMGFAFCALFTSLLGLVDGYNMFIVPVNFADGMTMLEGYGVVLLGTVVAIGMYDFSAAMSRIPNAGKLSANQKNIIINGVRTLLFLCIWAGMHLWDWMIN